MSIWLTRDVHTDIDAGKTLMHKSIFKKKKACGPEATSKLMTLQVSLKDEE